MESHKNSMVPKHLDMFKNTEIQKGTMAIIDPIVSISSMNGLLVDLAFWDKCDMEMAGIPPAMAILPSGYVNIAIENDNL